VVFVGIDIGSLSTEAVIVGDNRVIASVVLLTGSMPKKAGLRALEQALNQAGLGRSDVGFIVSTGYGRNLVDFADKTVTEITCHAKGAHFLKPSTEMVVDIGGQDSKIIHVDPNGRAVDFVMNDRCAAGTGRFLEVMARVLELDLDELGMMGLDAIPVSISSMCAVFAESEVVSLLAAEIPKERIVAGINKSIADKMAAMIHKFGPRNQVLFSGGVAKSKAVQVALERATGLSLVVPEEPQIVGALGAAIIASEVYDQRAAKSQEQLPAYGGTQ
jgi:(R)-2-hydroxyacyl-CoA dehydratese activating ATPase